MAVKVLTLIACLFVFLAVCDAQGSCSAIASIARRGESRGKGLKYDVTVTNTGDCSINEIEVEFAFSTGTHEISQTRNLLATGTENVYVLQNFGAELAANSSFSGARFTLECAGKADITVSVVTANCACTNSPSNATEAPTTAPTASPTTEAPKTPTTAPTTAPTEAPTTAPTVPPTIPGPDYELISRLKTAPSTLDRLAMLKDSDFVFDFTTSLTGVSAGNGGKTVSATASNFPALIGHDIAMTVGFLGACSMNLPHTHPRATEINFIAKGSFYAGFFMENNARFIENRLTPGMVTVFPRGAIHFEINLSCDDAVFVAGFNNEDPGVQTTASSFFGLPRDIVQSSLNVSRIQTVDDLAAFLPKNPAISLAECKARCGLQ